MTTDLGGGLQSYPARSVQPFLGENDAWDVLTFQASTLSVLRVFVGLDSGMAMFGNGVGSPLVTFAEIGAGKPTMSTGNVLRSLAALTDTISHELILS